MCAKSSFMEWQGNQVDEGSHRLNFNSVLFGEARLLETKLANNDADFIKCVCSRESNPFRLLLLNKHTRAKHAPKMSQDFSELRQDGTKTARVPKKIIDVQHPRAQKKKQANNSNDATTKSFTLLLALDVVSAPLQKQLESLVHL